jgi:nucleoid-associated protein YgaU
MKKILLSLMALALFFSLQAKETPNWKYQIYDQEYDTLTLEVYAVRLAEAQKREADAKTAIAEEQAKIASLRQQLIDIDAKIAAVIQEKYDILGITEQDVIDAEAEIAAIREDLELLLGLTPDELLKRIADIKNDENRIIALKEKPVSYLWRIRDQIVQLDELLERVKANLPDKLSSYTVKLIEGRRDCLYRIAEYDEIYGDPAQWPTIYRANQTTIDQGYERYKRAVEESKYSRSQDLIFPGQVFDIPR